MNSADQVQALIDGQKVSCMLLSDAIWNTGVACVGWPYVFGARGGLTTKNGIQVRQFDCRGFTYWVLLQYGIRIEGAGCTTQWNDDRNWKAKGMISDGIPDDVIVCLFYRDKDNPKKMAHTGFGYHGETVECSSGVQYFKKRKAKWTHWAIPAGVDGEVPEYKLTLRNGSKGEWVTKLQTILVQHGYDVGSAGVDGAFGRGTEAAVKSFQRDHGLADDGIVGQKTWAALDSDSPALYYSVVVPHLTKGKADALAGMYPGATITEEGG